MPINVPGPGSALCQIEDLRRVEEVLEHPHDPDAVVASAPRVDKGHEGTGSLG